VTFTAPFGLTVTVASYSNPAGGWCDHVTVQPCFASPVTRASSGFTFGPAAGSPFVLPRDFAYALSSAPFAAGIALAIASSAVTTGPDADAAPDAEAEAEAEAEAGAGADAGAEAEAEAGADAGAGADADADADTGMDGAAPSDVTAGAPSRPHPAIATATTTPRPLLASFIVRQDTRQTRGRPAHSEARYAPPAHALRLSSRTPHGRFRGGAPHGRNG